MRFTLSYRGPLRSNGGPADKHALRQHFHQQLAVLWNQLPLVDKRTSFLDRSNPDASLNVLRDIGGFTFAPLVCQKLGLVADLSITLLRPGPPGALLTHGGDIDNRLKTLLDSLKIPSEPNALPPGAIPAPTEDPFFCLLEDDALVTGIAVQTDRLLEATTAKDVLLLLHVQTKQLQVMLGTIGL